VSSPTCLVPPDCRIRLYWVKATALRGAAPERIIAGRAA
jgi:hypothetical protein